MAMTAPSTARLLAGLHHDDPQAVAALLQNYLDRLVRHLRPFIGRELQARFDPEDIAQSVFRTLCQRLRTGDLAPADVVDLWKLILCIAHRKLGHQIDRHKNADCRSVNRERPLDGDAPADYRLFAREPSPEEAAAVNDLLRWLADESDDPKRRAALELTLAGFTPEEIAGRLGVSRRTAERYRESFRTRLRAVLAGSPEGTAP